MGHGGAPAPLGPPASPAAALRSVPPASVSLRVCDHEEPRLSGSVSKPPVLASSPSDPTSSSWFLTSPQGSPGAQGQAASEPVAWEGGPCGFLPPGPRPAPRPPAPPPAPSVPVSLGPSGLESRLSQDSERRPDRALGTSRPPLKVTGLSPASPQQPGRLLHPSPDHFFLLQPPVASPLVSLPNALLSGSTSTPSSLLHPLTPPSRLLPTQLCPFLPAPHDAASSLVKRTEALEARPGSRRLCWVLPLWTRDGTTSAPVRRPPLCSPACPLLRRPPAGLPSGPASPWACASFGRASSVRAGSPLRLPVTQHPAQSLTSWALSGEAE